MTGIGCWAFGLVAAQIVWLSALTMVIRWEPAESATVVPEVPAVVVADAGVGVGEAVLLAVRDGEGEGDALVRVGVELALVMVVLGDETEAWGVEPSAASRVVRGLEVLNQTATPTAASTAIIDRSSVRADLRFL